jgi:hypothetical protein
LTWLRQVAERIVQEIDRGPRHHGAIWVELVLQDIVTATANRAQAAANACCGCGSIRAEAMTVVLDEARE